MTISPIRTALITGASAGLGSEFARQLAARGANLVLVARRKERLDGIAAELASRHGVTVDVLPADLSRDEEIRRVELRLAGGDPPDLLINNAGFGAAGQFSQSDSSTALAMVRVHVDAAVRLVRASLPGMIARGRGAIINVASVAAFSPVS